MSTLVLNYFKGQHRRLGYIAVKVQYSVEPASPRPKDERYVTTNNIRCQPIDRLFLEYTEVDSGTSEHLADNKGHPSHRSGCL
jgi:hypothetical protein